MTDSAFKYSVAKHNSRRRAAQDKIAMKFFFRIIERYRTQRDIVGEHRTWVHYLFLLFLLIAVVFSFRSCQTAFDALKTKETKLEKALYDLSLVSSETALKQRLHEWHSDPRLIKVARKTIETDNQFISPYRAFFITLAVFAFVFAFLWRSPVERLSWRKVAPWLVMVGVLLAIVLLALTDELENDCLKALFASPPTDSLSELRFDAQAKFLLLGGAALSIFIVLGIGLRREVRFWTRKTPATIAARHKFARLLKSEQDAILKAREDKNEASSEITVEAAEEPRASQCNVNFVGLALSGGGIRSATFNLGLLQGLHRYDLLRHVDYLATVSGGGYIGGFWSRWLKETARERGQRGIFPDRLKEAMKNFSGDSRTFETHEIRHVREFSNFLFPRVGIFDTETWGGAVALIAAILPAVATALSVLGLSLIAWLALTFYMACPDPLEFGWASPRFVFLVGATLTTFCVMELWWRAAPTGEYGAAKDLSVSIRSGLALGAVGLLAWVWQDCPALGQSKVWIYSPILRCLVLEKPRIELRQLVETLGHRARVAGSHRGLDLDSPAV